MMRLRGVTVDCSELDELAGFWGAALGYEPRSLWEPYAGVKEPTGRDPHLTFQRASGRGTNHLHLDLYSDDPNVDLERLVALGAHLVRRIDQDDTWWWVMRDPAGNEFCPIAAQGADRSLCGEPCVRRGCCAVTTWALER